MFRGSAATSITTDDPEHVAITRSLLGHSMLRTSERYYKQAGAMEAARRHQAHVLRLRRQLPSVQNVRVATTSRGCAIRSIVITDSV
jgi:hypothetical protein